MVFWAGHYPVASLQAGELPPRVQIRRLPYYFCDICGKVYLTQEELIEHRSSVHDKTPRQSQHSQSVDSTDIPSNQDTAQGERNTSVVENNRSSTEAASTTGETVTRKNGKDGEVDSKKEKVGSGC